MFRGLFIGIDRYAPPLTRLGAAKNDALALSALFEDSLSGDCEVLVDSHATRQRILGALEKLQWADPTDLVVIGFSGHGTVDHRLVPVDVDPEDLQRTCIGLDELARALDRIPGHMLVFLDCCFSGGFGGARVFSPAVERSVHEERGAVEALAGGGGRVVVTASGAGEPAIETTAFGHGIFTYHLLAALQGEGGVGSGGRISWLELLASVTSRVCEDARRLRTTQTPTVYGSFDGAPTVPLLVPGARFAESFPSRVRKQATSSWSSLNGFGFTNALLSNWASVIPGLNQLQQDAINDYGLLDGKSLMVVAPTGAGKTLIGELAALRAVVDGSRAVMLLPLKALVNDKYEEFTSTYADDAVVVRATGDHSDQVDAILCGQYDLALLTYEKFLNLALAFPHLLRGISVVVVDEAQTISDVSRGPSLEFLLTLLRSGYARGEPVQTVALSAVIGATNGLEDWLGGGLLRTEQRPVPLRESILHASGRLVTLEPDGTESERDAYVRMRLVTGSQSSKPWIIPLVERLVSEKKKVIVFRATRGETVGAARYLADALGLDSADDALLLPQRDRSDASDHLSYCVQHGVGFHNSDLDREERAALEKTFREPGSPLRVLVATTTLAMGVNTPAEAVIVAGLTHPSGDSYSVAEYKNMAGRAGRPGYSAAGEAYVVATGETTPANAWTRYVKGEPEPVVSRFLATDADPQTLILRSLVALGSSVEERELVALLEDSFAVWQRIREGGTGWDIDALGNDLEALIGARLLDREPSGHLTVTELGRYAGESGLEVLSVTNVASLLRFAPPTVSAADIILVAQTTAEMDEQYIPSNRKSIKERRLWRSTMLGLGAHANLLGSLHVGGGDPFMRMKRAVAALLYASDQPMSDIERKLLQHHRATSASGPVRAVANRTRDVLDAVCQIAQLSGRTLADGVVSGALGVRLEIGLPEELGSLAQVLGTLLTRGQYLGLLEAGLSSPTDLLARQSDLRGILGAELADRIVGRLADVP